MADVRPLKALHYDLAKVGGLGAVASPPYDVIDAAERARLLGRSPYNAVAIDLPVPFDPADPASRPVGDPYEDAARRICDGFARAGFEIAFPRRMAWLLKAINLLPYGLYFPVVGSATAGKR